MNELILEARERDVWPRRTFIKHFVLGTAFSMILGREWFATLLADCEPTTPTGGILRVKISDFPALQSENGSVRLLLNPINDFSQLPNGFFYPVLVNRGTGDQFFALNSRCTHQGCVVPTYDSFQGASVCPCHGSAFAIDGTRLSGLALSSLTRHTVRFDGPDSLCIEIPNLRYSLSGSVVESGVGPRFRLQFQTRLNVKYEVLFRQSIPDSGTIIPFSTSEGGTASSIVLNGNGATATLYVDRTSQAGFYSVGVQVTEG